MAFGYPVLLELAGRRAVVVGDFAVEAGKVEGLLAAGAEVTVVAKGPAAALDRLEADQDRECGLHSRLGGAPASPDDRFSAALGRLRADTRARTWEASGGC